MNPDAILFVVTDLANTALLAPLVVVGSAFLLSCGRRREAVIMTLSLLAPGIAVALLKLTLMGCHPLLPAPSLRSPSGHAALGASVYGTLALIIRDCAGPVLRWAATALAAGLIGAIAASRVVLGFHSAGEVMVGLALGLGFLAMAAHLLPGPGAMRGGGHGLVLLAVAAAAGALCHGLDVPAEELIRRWARALPNVVPFCAAS